MSEEGAGNVHTGAPPPWLDPVSNQDTMLQGSLAYNVKSPSQKSNKSRKLNPKRVGAAWAEKRRFELEMEKRGEMSAEKVDDFWLPNFGGVWQTGSRKMSKKDFEFAKQKVSEVFSQSEMPVEIRPYVSKKQVNFTSEYLLVSYCLLPFSHATFRASLMSLLYSCL